MEQMVVNHVVPKIDVMHVLLGILLMVLLLHVQEMNQVLYVLLMGDSSISQGKLANVIFPLPLIKFLVCDNACGECDFNATNCTTCPEGKNLDTSNEMWVCNSSDSSFNIFDHPWWLVLIAVFLIAVVVAAYFMFKDKGDKDSTDY